MHEYSRDDIAVCLGGKRVLFVGDSTMRVLFFAALTRLDFKAARWLLRTTLTEENPRHDLIIESNTVQLQFIWDPWLNSTKLENELTQFESERGAKDVASTHKADLVIIGSSGLWAARNTPDSLYFDTFRASTDRVVRIMGDSVLPFGMQKTNNYVFLAPVQIPRYEMLLDGRARTLSPERIGRMNNYLGSFSPTVQSHILTAYNDMTYHVPEAYQDTGLHVLDAVAERWIDVPLNARCNGMLLGLPANERPAPSVSHLTTCCAAPPEPVRGQVAMLYGICASVIVPILVLLLKNRAAALSSYISYTFLGPALLYCYLAERSHALAKSEKHFQASWMGISFAVVGICFAASLRRRPVPKGGPQTYFLPRHISDEWKGLMQATILLLSYQDDSQISFVVRWTEFVTASYLFLSAYGHTTYFLRYENFSLRRVFLILVRLNLLPNLLALMLDGYDTGTPHSVSRLVMFPRLISFWFVIVYIILRVGSPLNQNYPHMVLLKILVAATIMANVLFLPGNNGFFETMNRISQLMFGTSTWDIEEMQRAIYADWCAPFAGMAVAVFAHCAAIVCDRMQLRLRQKEQHFSGRNLIRRGHLLPKQSVNGRTDKLYDAKVKASTPTSNDQFSYFTSPEDITIRKAIGRGACLLDRMLLAILYPDEFTAPVQPMTVIFCSLFFGVFASLTTVSKILDNNQSHPYLTTAAVVCLAVVRNAHSRLRITYMALPAALGAMSLELYVLRNHILLSGNGTGHLRLFSFYQPAIEDGRGSLGEYLVAATVTVVHCLDIASITMIFLAVARHTHHSTQMLASAISGDVFTGTEDLDLSVMAEDSAKLTDDGLPQHNKDRLIPQAADALGPRRSSVLLRSSGVLFIYWSLSRYYL